MDGKKARSSMSTGCTVMVADDSAFAQKLIASCLAGTEFEIVATAKTGAETIEQFKAHEPDVLLLDVILPDQQGSEVLRAIMEINPAAKVLMVSSLGTEENIAECLSVGAKTFIQKPFDKETLIGHIRQLANK